MTTLHAVFRDTVRRLDAIGVPDAHFEARVLLGHTLHVSPTQMYSSPERRLAPGEVGQLRCVLERRLSREPSAYITGRKEFFGHDFAVDPNVLIPRPETELLVEKAIEFAITRGAATAADIGTGSGAIAISLALALPTVRVYATDVSHAALELARVNCVRHSVSDRISLLEGNLLEPLPQSVDMVVANLPYVADGDFAGLTPEITRFEPRLALSGGPDGLALYRELLHSIGSALRPGGCLLAEVGHNQAEPFLAIARALLPNAVRAVFKDLSNLNRVVKLVLAS